MKHLIAIAIAAASLSLFAADAHAKGEKNCPPGLAKKTPACVPPGLAKKGVTAKDRGYEVGDRIDDHEYTILETGDRVIFDDQEYIVVNTDYGPVLRRGDDWYRLPRSSTSDYVRIGDSLVKIDRQTKEVIDLIRLADLILS